MNTLNFNDADLKANREGRLSDAQAKRFDAEVNRIQKLSKYQLWVCIAVFAFIAIMMAMNVYTSAQQDQTQMTSRLMIIVLVVGASGFMFVFLSIVLDYWRSTNSLINSPICALEGTVQTISVPAYFILDRVMIAASNKLILRRAWYSSYEFDFENAESLQYFRDGGRYRIYYLPYKGRQLLSAEEIEPEKAKR